MGGDTIPRILGPRKRLLLGRLGRSSPFASSFTNAPKMVLGSHIDTIPLEAEAAAEVGQVVAGHLFVRAARAEHEGRSSIAADVYQIARHTEAGIGPALKIQSLHDHHS